MNPRSDLNTALREFCGTFADGYLAEEVGPHLSCTEAEALANLFDAMDMHSEAEDWRRFHRCSVNGEDGEDTHYLGCQQ